MFYCSQYALIYPVVMGLVPDLSGIMWAFVGYICPAEYDSVLYLNFLIKNPRPKRTQSSALN